MTAPEHAHSACEHANEHAANELLTAPKSPAPSDLPGSPTAGSNDLRDRIAEALALQLNGPASDGRGWYRTAADRVDCYARADAVMAVVKPVIDAKDAENARLCEDLQARIDDHAMTAKYVGEQLGMRQALPAATSIGCAMALGEDLAEAKQRAEAAEAEAATLRSDNDRLRGELDVFRTHHQQIGDLP